MTEWENHLSVKIKILPENLTNKIAAGEVVERPASVVKELVENSLDAGCGEVIIEIEAGGRNLIRVADNGCGMGKEDALLSLERHATSKIATDGDLFHLSTLGFRGEALPSIASVSRFTLATREGDRVEGTEIYAEGGRLKEVKASGQAQGTVITVRNLFFNTPARLKFMKSRETESGHVGEVLTRLAISRPAVRFSFVNDGRTVFRVLDGGLKDRVGTLFGISLANNMHPVDFQSYGISVSGLVAFPYLNRSAPSHLYTYINGRFIRDRVVQHAILQAYRNFMERGRYPIVVVFIQIPPGEVDVNVHPTKHEVRFREQGRVHEAIQGALESVLRGTPWVRPKISMAPTEYTAPAPSPISAGKVNDVRESLEKYSVKIPRQETIATPSYSRHAADRAPIPATDADTGGFFSGLNVIGQFNAAYILCQDGPDLIIIDQHAAHERVAFQHLKGQFCQGGVETQGLLFPETVDLSL